MSPVLSESTPWGMECGQTGSSVVTFGMPWMDRNLRAQQLCPENDGLADQHHPVAAGAGGGSHGEFRLQYSSIQRAAGLVGEVSPGQQKSGPLVDD